MEKNINNIYKEIVINLANIYMPRIKGYIYNYYYDHIYLVLKELSNWRSLKVTRCELHFTSIFKVYRRWCELNIFKEAYYILLRIFGYNLEHLFKYNINLLIDSMTVFNKRGREGTSIIPQYSKKKGTKIHIIGTKDKVPLISRLTDVKRSDSGEVVNCLDELHTLFYINRNINLIGDKAYKMENIKHLLKIFYKTRCISYNKKNQIKKNTRTENNKLKDRIYIENINKLISDYDRLELRKDHKLSSYFGFLFMAVGLNFIKQFIK